MLLQGKTALITGCSRGIGRCTLRAFAENGANVWASFRQSAPGLEGELDELSNRTGVQIKPVYFDLSNPAEIQEALRGVLSAKTPIDILVNNAAMVSDNALFMMTPMHVIRQVFEVNLFGALLVTQLIARSMVRHKRGAIVNIVSVAALDGDPGQLEYVASKAALIGATKKLSRELASFGIRVNAVAPGIIDTEMVSGMSSDLFKRTIEKSAMRATGTVNNVADAVLFLASERASHITGQVLRVDGGM